MKRLRTILSIVTTIATLASANCLAAFAQNLNNPYGLGDKTYAKYTEYVETLTRSPLEKMENEMFPYSQVIKLWNSDLTCQGYDCSLAEMAMPQGGVEFVNIVFMWDKLISDKTTDSASAEEINKFLSAKGFKASVSSIEKRDDYTDTVTVSYEKNATEKDKSAVGYALFKEYSLRPALAEYREGYKFNVGENGSIEEPDTTKTNLTIEPSFDEMLRNKIAALEEELKENEIYGEEADELLALYVDGLRKIAESGVMPVKLTEDYYRRQIESGMVWKNNRWELSYVGSSQSSEQVVYTDKKGSLASGAVYNYNPQTKGLVLDGKGEVTFSEVSDLRSSFEVNYIVFGRNIAVPQMKDADKYAIDGHKPNSFINLLLEKNSDNVPVFAYQDSNFTETYDDMIKWRAAKTSQSEENIREYFKYNLIPEDTDVYSVYYEKPEPVKPERLSVVFGKEACMWAYEAATKEMTLLGRGTLDEKAFLESVEKKLDLYGYEVEKVKLGSENEFIVPGYEKDISGAEAYVLDLLKNRAIDKSNNEQTASIDPDLQTENVSIEEDLQTETAAAEATLKGDADLNGALGLADAIAVSKFNLNSKIYPLANTTAMANADMNGDGAVDSNDLSMIIEANLGN